MMDALTTNETELFWIAKLHAALAEKGFYASDDDVECIWFGESTTAALQCWQASQGLNETGVIKAEDWPRLLLDRE